MPTKRATICSSASLTTATCTWPRPRSEPWVQHVEGCTCTSPAPHIFQHSAEASSSSHIRWRHCAGQSQLTLSLGSSPHRRPLPAPACGRMMALEAGDHVRGGILCDEPGLGKTITALALIASTLAPRDLHRRVPHTAELCERSGTYKLAAHHLNRMTTPVQKRRHHLMLPNLISLDKARHSSRKRHEPKRMGSLDFTTTSRMLMQKGRKRQRTNITGRRQMSRNSSPESKLARPFWIHIAMLAR